MSRGRQTIKRRDGETPRRGATEEMKSRGAFIPAQTLTRTWLRRANRTHKRPDSRTRASPSAARQVADSPSGIGQLPSSPR